MDKLYKDNTCRICLKQHETVFLLSNIDRENEKLSAGLHKFGVSSTLSEPKSICSVCLTELEVAINFIEKCEKSNQILTVTLPKVVVPNKRNIVVKNDLALALEIESGDVGLDVIEDRTDCNFDEELTASKGNLNEKRLKVTNAYTCSICQKTFNRKFNYKLHIQRHSGDFDWACPTCGLRVASRWLAQRHCKPRPRRPCPMPGCSKTYTSQANLATHIRAHNGDRPFECTECGKRFTSRNTLADHIRIHTGAKPYICAVCGARFTTNKLSAHMWTHRGGAPRAFACVRAGCARRFASRRALTTHARTHGAPASRDHACALCPATYHYKQSLNKHIKKQHHAHQPVSTKPGGSDAGPRRTPGGPKTSSDTVSLLNSSI